MQTYRELPSILHVVVIRVSFLMLGEESCRGQERREVPRYARHNMEMSPELTFFTIHEGGEKELRRTGLNRVWWYDKQLFLSE